jgi:hypothetical protein
MVKIGLIATILIFSNIILYSQGLKAFDYQEVWLKKIPISGGLKVGTMYSVSSISKVQKSFFVKLPTGNYKLLCVKVTSRDGRFYASMNYDINNTSGGLLELQLPTKYWNELQNYTTDKLVILGTLGSNCNTEEEIIVPASWDKNDMKGILTIAVNSDKFPKVEIYDVKAKKSKDYPCKVLEGTDKIAYKCLCEIPLVELPKLYEVNIYHKVRSGPTMSFKSFPIKLKI